MQDYKTGSIRFSSILLLISLTISSYMFFTKYNKEKF